MTHEIVLRVCRMALGARRNSYAPYSHFAVGASLLCADGKIYTGCNIESAAYSPSCCAERVALYKAVSEGERNFTALAVAGGPDDRAPEDYCPPCGVCRQVMAEFCGEDFPVFLVKSETEQKAVTLGGLLPFRFGLKKGAE